MRVISTVVAVSGGLMTYNRRGLIAGMSAAAAGAVFPGKAGVAAVAPFVPKAGPRSRLLFVNDLSGDVDGLFAGVHALLSPSLDLRGVVGTATGTPGETAEASVALAHEMRRLAGRTDVPVYPGADRKLDESGKPRHASGVQAILDEAVRTDSNLPLYVAVGGGLTEVASALMLEPSIAGRMTLIWIGGTLSATQADTEYNVAIDRRAAQYVFNETQVPIWQVPREAYLTCAVSLSEIAASVAPHGPVGEWLYDKLRASAARFAGYRMNTGETWIMGDNPLVLLTALTDWVPSAMGRQPRYERTGSSPFLEVNAPRLDAEGRPRPRDDGRRIRIYTGLDTRMMFSDLYAKLRLSAQP